MDEDNIFGGVEAPPGVAKYNALAGGDIGLVLFVSNVIRIITIAGGIMVMINIIMAGWIYITSQGDSSAHQKVIDTILFSVLGLAIIVASYAAAAIAGLIFFGDATYILNPYIVGPNNGIGG